MKRSRLISGLLIVPLTLVTACTSPPPPSSSPPATVLSTTQPTNLPGQLTQTSEGGQVTAIVSWAGVSAGAVFDVKLDTHSIDLDALDLSDAILRNDRGETLPALPWAAPQGGHHRAGSLTFGGDYAAFFSGAKWVELVLVGVGDMPERTLRWDLGA